ncbi:hypothetical protein Anapl_14733 [Anas platyrhynchos]|uniref:Uncharacterized protein n=1 Tax=Anas platyrhynchos TaxID=8839 RepID=R0JP45_ANAPL|nr:hypothetical protein Anapl_14733 [Anas platyrhynchos]
MVEWVEMVNVHVQKQGQKAAKETSKVSADGQPVCPEWLTNSSTVFLLHKGGEGEIAGLMFAIKAKLIASTTTNKKEDVPTNSLCCGGSIMACGGTGGRSGTT